MQFALQASKSAPQSGAVESVAHAVTMSSREIAELTGKEHRNVMRDIRVMLSELYGAGGVLNFEQTYRNEQNGQEYPEFLLPRREVEILLTGYSVALRAKVIDRLRELEAQQLRIPQTLSEALRLAADQAEQIERQQQALIAAEPKVRFYDNYADGTGLKGFRQVAKLIGAKEGEFREFLASKRIMYRLGGEWVAYADHINAGRFAVKTGQADNGHNYNAAKFTPKGVEWIAGLWAAHNLKKAMESARQAHGGEV